MEDNQQTQPQSDMERMVSHASKSQGCTWFKLPSELMERCSRGEYLFLHDPADGMVNTYVAEQGAPVVVDELVTNDFGQAMDWLLKKWLKLEKKYSAVEDIRI